MSGENQKLSFQIPARAAAISSICVNLVLAIVIGIILSISEVDFLSTLALALAVIAFIVQIMVFIHQSSASTMQLARSEELHGSTMRALAAIEEKAEGTRRTVTTMSDQMLEAMLNKGFSAKDSVYASDIKVEGGISVPKGEDAASVLPVVAETRTPRTVNWTAFTANEEKKTAELLLPTGKRREEAVAILKEMEPSRLRSLSWIAADYKSYANNKPDRIGHGVDDKSVPREMYDLGLVKRVRASWDPDLTVGVLTDKGKDAAALLLRSDLPADIDEAVIDARERLKNHNELIDRSKRENETELGDVPVEG